jgi:biopolymer transport protein ExbD
MKLTTPAHLIIDLALLILLAAWIVAWPDGSPPDPGPRVELPLVERGHGPRCIYDPCEPATVTVTVDSGGAVFVVEKATDPDSLEPALAPHVRRLERYCRQVGTTALADLPGGGRASKLEVLLRVDRRTKWKHVEPALFRIGVAGLYGVQFAVRWRDRHWNRSRTVLPAHLPPPPRSDDSVTYFRETFGPAAPDLADLRRRARDWFHANLEREDVRLVVELQPHPDTPFEHVAHVLEALLDLGLEKIDFLDESGERAVVVPR